MTGLVLSVWPHFQPDRIHRQIKAQPQAAILAGQIFQFTGHLDKALPLGQHRTAL